MVFGILVRLGRALMVIEGHAGEITSHITVP